MLSALKWCKDGALTLDEAILQVTGNKLIGPEPKPYKTMRDGGKVEVGDLPLTLVNANDGQLEQFCDISLNEEWVFSISCLSTSCKKLFCTKTLRLTRRWVTMPWTSTTPTAIRAFFPQSKKEVCRPWSVTDMGKSKWNAKWDRSKGLAVLGRTPPQSESAEVVGLPFVTPKVRGFLPSTSCMSRKAMR